MKTSNFKLAFLLIFIVCHSEISRSQSNQIPSVQIMAENGARGQTNIMIGQLKIDSTLFGSIYNINYNFQVQELSSRMGDTRVSNYVSNYEKISHDRDELLKKILTSDQFLRYTQMMEDWDKRALELKTSNVH